MLAGSMLSGLKQVSAIENRPAADRSRSRDFLPRSTFEARLEGTPTRSPNKKSAGSAKPRPQYHCPDPHDCRGHHGSLPRVPVAESRLRRAVSGRLRRLSRGPLRGFGEAVSGRSYVQRRAVWGSEAWLLRMCPYPVYGTAGPVGGGPRGRCYGRADPGHIGM